MHRKNQPDPQRRIDLEIVCDMMAGITFPDMMQMNMQLGVKMRIANIRPMSHAQNAVCIYASHVFEIVLRIFIS